ncbi:hypothetical protein BD311DRAFT_668829 [Dichomitus squalens]|uniref:Uncharacterized protein n=1 Tax=Dichomitus squalens TaxID=114155 RepID=A0A4Q9MHX9_9APHY|nr:hypothetical protein BD311DRAFT_668829 [Dichomitus squalens]
MALHRPSRWGAYYPYVLHSFVKSYRSRRQHKRIHETLIILLSLSPFLTSVQGRGFPTFEVHSIPDLTPCSPFTFSWTGGTAPFALFMIDDDTGDTVDEFQNIESSSFTWTPELGESRRLLLFAQVLDVNDNDDETEDFVVQAASCTTSSSSVSSITLQSTAVSSTTITVTASASPPPAGISSPTSVAATSHPTQSSSTLQTPSSHETSAPSTSLLSSSSILSANSGSTITSTTTATVGSVNGFTSFPDSKAPSTSMLPSPSTSKAPSRAGEIAGIVLGALALLCMLIIFVIWRRATRRSSPNAHSAEEKSIDVSSSHPEWNNPSQYSKATMLLQAYPRTSRMASTGLSEGSTLLDDDRSGILPRGSNPSSVAVEPSASDCPIRSLSQHLPRPHSNVDKGANTNGIEFEASTSLTDMDRVARGAEERPSVYVDESKMRSVANMEGDAIWDRTARMTRTESDGGIRLAGGPQDIMDAFDDGATSTLPPPYHRYEV